MAEKANPHTRFVSLRLKLVAALLALFGVLAGGIFYWYYTFSHDLVTHRFYDFTTDTATERLHEDMDALLGGVSSEIDGDQFAALVADRRLLAQTRAEETAPNAGIYPDDLRYWQHVNLLNTIQRADPRHQLYTYVAGDEPNTVVWIGSSGAAKPEPTGVKFRQVTEYAPADAAVILRGLEKRTFFLQVYEDEYGKWVSGYTPIYDSSGQPVGGLGIDFRAEYVETVQHSLKQGVVRDVLRHVQEGILLATGITTLAVILMVFGIARVLTQPIILLTRAATRISEGDYDQDLTGLTSGRTSDEISTLAHVFEVMIDRIRQREEHLKKQLGELQIVIDEGKKQEQVEELVDSDFFRDLDHPSSP